MVTSSGKRTASLNMEGSLNVRGEGSREARGRVARGEGRAGAPTRPCRARGRPSGRPTRPGCAGRGSGGTASTSSVLLGRSPLRRGKLWVDRRRPRTRVVRHGSNGVYDAGLPASQEVPSAGDWGVTGRRAT